MKKNKLTLEEVRALHEARKLDSAKEGYLQLLKKDPRSVEILDWLAILYVQQENYSEAINYLQKALKIQPKNPVLNLHYANILKIEGLFSEAAKILEKTIELHPNYIPLVNNLGTVYYAQEKYEAAVNCFEKAIQQQANYVDAFYNLGLTFIKLNQLEKATAAFERALALAPNHFAGKFQLAIILMREEKIDDAITRFLQIEESYPHHFETQSNLATCYLKLGALNDAKYHYLKALELKADDTQILFNLAVINIQQGNTDTAIQQYQHIIQINPDDFAAHNNLAVAFLSKQHTGFALQHFQEAFRIQPNNIAIAHTLKILSEHQHLLASPPDYIRSLFDAYADHYDPHLLTALDYQIPQLFFTLAEKTKKLNPNALDILDLGCGTGLTAKPFSPYAKSLTGVDLSEKMLAVAFDKKIFTELVNDDLEHFLQNKINQYDLILAGDVLVYIGKLDNLFKKMSEALKHQGILIFNTEISEQGDFKMNQSGRFSHYKNYLEKLARENHLKILTYQTSMTRLQNNEPVYGHVFVMEKQIL